jgi:hypothetical protein
MFKASRLVGALGLSAVAVAANAQTAADITQRDIIQEARIRNGLQDGKLTDAERARITSYNKHHHAVTRG